MKKFILAFHHLIVLIWLVLILIVFKITTNFKFKNGSSLIFLALIITFPTFIYIFTILNKKKIRNQKKHELPLYFQQIKDDQKKNKFQELLLDKIKECNLDYSIIVENSTIKINVYNIDRILFIIEFMPTFACIKINETNVKYNFYYSYHIDEYTKYDLRNFEYKETKILYMKLIEKIQNLINKKYVYIQSNKLLKLIEQETSEIIYEVNLNKKIYYYLEKEKKEIIL